MLPTRSDRADRRFLLLLAASVVLHALVFLGYSLQARHRTWIRPGLEWLQVSLQTPDSPSPHSIKNRQQSSIPVLPTLESVMQDSPVRQEHNVAGGSKHVTSATRADAEENHLLGSLRTRLGQLLIYPPIARERGWEGEVRVKLVVTASGVLTDIQLARSSGYPVLDAVSLQSLRQVGTLPPPGKPWQLTLPIQFRLADNI